MSSRHVGSIFIPERRPEGTAGSGGSRQRSAGGGVQMSVRSRLFIIIAAVSLLAASTVQAVSLDAGDLIVAGDRVVIRVDPFTGSNGMRTVKVLPRGSLSLTATLPPCISTKRFTTCRRAGSTTSSHACRAKAYR